MGIARKEAAALIGEYFQQYPAVKRYIETNVADINSRNAGLRSFAERNPVNMPIQGTSADMIKIAMVRIWKRLKDNNMRSKMILQVHDELVFDVYKPELESVTAIVKKEMEEALPLTIPVDVGIDVGDNWLEAH